MDNDHQELESEETVMEEDDEKNTQLNAQNTKFVSEQQFCFRILFLVSIGIFISLGFFLASSNTSNSYVNKFKAILSSLIGSILLKRIFLTNIRTDRTSSLDYALSTQKVKERINEMFAFEAHYYTSVSAKTIFHELKRFAFEFWFRPKPETFEIVKISKMACKTSEAGETSETW
ncbi:636_t:CDS:2 [Racocetra fulgida]|uniref:636_t:CDS:1 n=1 Tax=Racocetra fulgida TaxID=60492 RepID=A0A9N9B8X1_9GLOM|nr:636_t:CDS:2 [Racocetra fulgida]